ncbi:MAG: ABC-three component system protein [Prosthecobacter sp.]
MKYAYEDLSPKQFEDLVVFLCKKLLGISVLGFPEGPDAGRDAKFVGRAELFPSKSAQWMGTTIIQAKHTNGYNRRFSEPDFFHSESIQNTIGEEIIRIKKLRDEKQLDHYMLFANRRLGSIAESQIRTHISKETGIPEESICLCGIEQLEQWLKIFPDVATHADLDPVDSPLIVSPDDLAEVVQALALQKDDISKILDAPPAPRIPYEKKNELNNMTAEYAAELRRRYLKETGQIKTFLAAPENADLLQKYESIVEEFQLKIIAKRKDYQTFDQVMEYLLDLLFGRDAALRQHIHKRLTRVVLFYMYWNCDIGEVGNAETF